MRLHQPTGVWLLFWPCAWGLALGAQGFPPLSLLALFFLGAVVMRGAGCIINDLWDRDIDREVERTRDRPIASGAVGVPHALCLLAVLLAIGFAIVWQMPHAVFWWALASMPLVVLYPLMKRITWWPQAFLGLTFNWGVWMGWVALRPALTAAPLCLYTAGVFWTLGYDTIYAHQDKQDDARIGVKSTARRLGDRTRLALFVFYSLSLSLCFTAGLSAGFPLLPFGLALLPVALHFTWQWKRLDTDDPTQCLHLFRSNSMVGLLVFLALSVSTFI